MISRLILGVIIVLASVSLFGGFFALDLGYPAPTWFYFAMGPVILAGLAVFSLGCCLVIDVFDKIGRV